jgi:hypothetical protein
VSEPDITKGKKKGRKVGVVTEHHVRWTTVYGRRGERHDTYENLNRPAHAPTRFDADDDDDDENVMAPDQVKGTMGNAHQPDGRDLSAARVSPSRVQGNASPATDHHGTWVDPMTPMGPRELAWRHPDMRFGTTNPVPLMSMRTDANPHPHDLSGAAGVGIALSRLDAYNAAGAPGFRQQPTGNPAMRQMDHLAPTSALPANGGHSLSNPSRPPIAAMKWSEAVDAVKRTQRPMFPGGGAR